MTGPQTQPPETQPRGLPGKSYLELFVQRPENSEFHLYAANLLQAGLADALESLVRPLNIFITRMPPDLLNPSHWELLTRDAENEVRHKNVGIVTRIRKKETQLWRSDQVAPASYLRDGLEADIELLSGFIFKTDGKGLLCLDRAWNRRDHFEWAGLVRGDETVPSPDTLASVHADLSQMRLSRPDEEILFSSQDEDAARLVLSDENKGLDLLGALLRGFVRGATGRHAGYPGRAFCAQIMRIAEGAGLSASAGDLLDTGRTVEITARRGRTRWGVQLHEPPPDDETFFIYYDRISGIWAVSS